MLYGYLNILAIENVDNLDVDLRGCFSFFNNDISDCLVANFRGYIDYLL
jgi:hypothetical protein